MRAALYARVSTPASAKKLTKEGERERQDPEVQLVKLRAYAKARGWEIVDEYVDRLSGKDANRPDLKRLLDDAAAHRFDAILIVRLDRIMRSVKNFHDMLAELEGCRVGLITTDSGIDTTTPGGRLLRNIMADVSEYEREIISSRVKDGMAKARAEGKRFGRPRKKIDLDAYREALRVTGNAKRAAAAIGVPYSTVRERLNREASEIGQQSGAKKGGTVRL